LSLVLVFGVSAAAISYLLRGNKQGCNPSSVAHASYSTRTNVRIAVHRATREGESSFYDAFDSRNVEFRFFPVKLASNHEVMTGAIDISNATPSINLGSDRGWNTKHHQHHQLPRSKLGTNHCAIPIHSDPDSVCLLPCWCLKVALVSAVRAQLRPSNIPLGLSTLHVSPFLCCARVFVGEGMTVIIGGVLEEETVPVRGGGGGGSSTRMHALRAPPAAHHTLPVSGQSSAVRVSLCRCESCALCENLRAPNRTPPHPSRSLRSACGSLSPSLEGGCAAVASSILLYPMPVLPIPAHLAR
jgi:hypothetical protein